MPRPVIKWTPSQERQLVRFRINHDVEWDDMPIVMRDDLLGFAPSRSNCCNKWNEMTNMPSNNLQVKDLVMKRRRNEMAVRAYNEYRKRHGHPDPDQAPVLSPLEPYAKIDMFEAADPAAHLDESQSPYSITNTIVAPSLSFGATTPSNPRTETGTPTPGLLDIFGGGDVAESSAASLLADSMQVTTSESKVGQKRLAPPDFDIASPPGVGYSGFNTNARHVAAWAKTTSDRRLDMTADGASRAKVRSLVSSINATKAKAKTVADVEKKKSLPKGFLSHIKRLSGLSADSARSSSGSARSRWSRISSKLDSDIPKPEDLSLVTVSRRVTDLFHQWRSVGEDVANFTRRLELLIQDGADIDARDETNDDNRPLHIAIIAGHVPICQVLLEKGANVNAQNQHGETPLAIAVVVGNHEACDLLLRHEANVKIKTNEGLSISSLGRRAREQARHNLARYLAIEGCRNFVREHNPQRRTRKASKTRKYTAVPPVPHLTTSDLGTVGDIHRMPMALYDLDGAQPRSTEFSFISKGVAQNSVQVVHPSSFPNPGIRLSDVLSSPTLVSQGPNRHTVNDIRPASTVERPNQSRNPSSRTFPLPSSPSTLGCRASQLGQREEPSTACTPLEGVSQTPTMVSVPFGSSQTFEHDVKSSVQSSLQMMPQQNESYSAAPTVCHAPTTRLDNDSLNQLYGSIQQLPTGEFVVMSLPLPNQDHAQRMFNSGARVTIQIVSPPTNTAGLDATALPPAPLNAVTVQGQEWSLPCHLPSQAVSATAPSSGGFHIADQSGMASSVQQGSMDIDFMAPSQLASEMNYGPLPMIPEGSNVDYSFLDLEATNDGHSQLVSASDTRRHGGYFGGYGMVFDEEGG